MQIRKYTLNLLKIAIKNNKNSLYIYVATTIAIAVTDVIMLISLSSISNQLSGSEQVTNFEIINQIQNRIGVFSLLIILCISLILSSIFRAGSTIFQFKLSGEWETNLITYAISYYLNQDFEEYNKKNISDYVKIILTDTQKFVQEGLMPLIQFIMSIASIIIVMITLVMLRPKEVIILIFFLFISYALVYKLVSIESQRYSALRQTINRERYSIISDIFNCFVEIKTFGIKDSLLNKTLKLNKEYTNSLYKYEKFAQIPRYYIEIIIFLFIITFIIIEKINNKVELAEVIGTSILMIAGITKLMPSVASIYNAIMRFRHIIPLIKDLDYSECRVNENNNFLVNKENICKIKLLEISYAVKGKSIFTNYSCQFNNKIINIVKGKSGRGKSTLALLLLGIIRPNKGTINFETESKEIFLLSEINPKIAYVPQNVKFIGDNLAYAVSLKENPNEVEIRRIKEALIKSCCEDFINLAEVNLSKFNIKNLSGGQKQRIAIARAIYSDLEIIILDEPTSALDKYISEKLIKNLEMLAIKKIVIIFTHDNAFDRFTCLELN